MTLIIDLAPDIERALAIEASRLGVPVEAAAADVLASWAEDAADLAEAERVMNETGPGDWIPLDKVLEEIKSERGA